MSVRWPTCWRSSTGLPLTSRRCSHCARGRVLITRVARSLWVFRSGLFAQGFRGRGRIFGNSQERADMKQVEDTCEWDAWLMNEFLELLPVPAEREMPAGSLERRKAALVQLIGAEVSLPGRAAGRLARLRSLRVWLTTLGLVIAVLVSVCSALAATHVRKRGTRATVETVLAVAGGPAVAALAAAPRVRGRVAIRLSGIGREHAGPVGAAPGHARLMTLRRSRRRWLAPLGFAAFFAL